FPQCQPCAQSPRRGVAVARDEYGRLGHILLLLLQRSNDPAIMPTPPVTDYFNALPIDPRRRVAPATARNRDPILAVLREHIPLPARVLELASGTGEHGAYFCTQLPELQWQPSDADPD